MPVSASTLLDKTATFRKALAAMTESKVMVGVPSKTAQRKDDPINNAAIGYIQENGSETMGIPPRPFLVPGVSDASKEIASVFKTGSVALMTGDISGFKKSLNAAGLVGQSAVQKKITDGPFEPLKPSTIAARERRGRKGTKPLIDSGQLRRAITYIIRGI